MDRWVEEGREIWIYGRSGPVLRMGVKSLILTFGSDFPGEPFRVLKEKEIKQLGEYRTRGLVLEAWDRLKVK